MDISGRWSVSWWETAQGVDLLPGVVRHQVAQPVPVHVEHMYRQFPGSLANYWTWSLHFQRVCRPRDMSSVNFAPPAHLPSIHLVSTCLPWASAASPSMCVCVHIYKVAHNRAIQCCRAIHSCSYSKRFVPPDGGSVILIHVVTKCSHETRQRRYALSTAPLYQ